MEFFFLSSFTSLHQRQEAEAPDSVANFVWFHAEERLKEQTVLLSVEFLSPGAERVSQDEQVRTVPSCHDLADDLFLLLLLPTCSFSPPPPPSSSRVTLRKKT